MDSYSNESLSDSVSHVERTRYPGDLQDLAGNLTCLETRIARAAPIPILKKSFENNIPVVTADLTPRKRDRREKTPIKTHTRSVSPIGQLPGGRRKKPLLDIDVEVAQGKVVRLPVYCGDTSTEVANRLILDSSKLALRCLSEEIEREVQQYMTIISKELVSYQRSSKETVDSRSRALLEKAKPPNLQTAWRAKNRDRQVLGAVNVDPGNGSPWVITVREGDKAVDLAMEFCTKHGLSHSQLEDISGPIQELINTSELHNPIFKLQIEVGPGKTAPLEVRTGDDLHLVAARFVEQHRLGKHLIKTIHDLLVKTESVHDSKRLIRVSEVIHYE